MGDPPTDATTIHTDGWMDDVLGQAQALSGAVQQFVARNMSYRAGVAEHGSRIGEVMARTEEARRSENNLKIRYVIKLNALDCMSLLEPCHQLYSRIIEEGQRIQAVCKGVGLLFDDAQRLYDEIGVLLTLADRALPMNDLESQVGIFTMNVQDEELT
eukprot:CAMPEP_0202110874 /NCGR_PEP_ID=MMETSP0965-20130614/27684_1 /ASSEMBLY_ACC=CAM_ASM_000507 /TAXON_ID=4773 /ORGANISM="Schizochytrium aggregatum, Strain ATCC28209" /LENGTH=157 /DNA_ID=CAMNT_0048680323 /DNA_START=322 /DNA_END=791 /DNA_ORIENTATION=-